MTTISQSTKHGRHEHLDSESFHGVRALCQHGFIYIKVLAVRKFQGLNGN